MSEIKSVRVALRVRPISEAEIERGHACVVKVVPSTNGQEVTVGDGKISSDRFTYNHTFDCNATQRQLYETAVVELLDKLFEGFNVTILAYGQTCSGKTYTMGTDYTGELGDNAGVIPRAVTDIFRIIGERVAVEQSVSVPTTITCSFIELYQEIVYDLLSKTRQSLEIREGGNGVILQGLTEVPVDSVQATLDCLLRGSSGRCVGATAMNSVSSRSHAVFTINISMPSSNDPQSVVQSKFQFVDLAGSERSKKTQATGDRFKEGVKINQGLLALGNVISALSSLATSSAGATPHVPYRDSKLTRLLQDSLGGNSYTLMIACISPADNNKDETLSTLRYADRVCKIKNKPIVNVDPNRAIINQLQATIEKLEQKIVILERNNDALRRNASSEVGKCTPTNSADNSDDARLLRLEEKNQHLQEKLQSTLQHLATSEMRALAAELTLDEIETKVISTDHTENGNATFIDNVLTAYKEERKTLETTFDDGQENVERHDSYRMLPDDLKKASDSHTRQQLSMRKQLSGLNQVLAQKEKLRRCCIINGDDEDSDIPIKTNELQLRLQEHERNIMSLEEQLVVQNEQLENAKTNDKASKLAEERRRKLQQVESELAEMRKQRLLLQNQLKMKEADSKRVVTLTADIKAMKRTRIEMLKNIRADHEKFRQWRQEQLKQICQLKAKDRKRQYAFQQLETKHSMQEQTWQRRMAIEKKAMQRKMDETAAVNRRLMAALDRRQRNNGGTDADRSALRGAEAQQWIDQELELLHSAVEATETLKMQQKYRAEEEKELAKLKREADEEVQNENEQPTLKMSKEWIAFYEDSLRVRNETIADFEQKLVSVNIGEQLATLSDRLIKLPELREAVRRLLDTVVQKDAALIEERVQKSETQSKNAAAWSNYGKIIEEVEARQMESRMRYEQLRHVTETDADDVFLASIHKALLECSELKNELNLLDNLGLRQQEPHRSSRGYLVSKKPKFRKSLSSVQATPDDEEDEEWNVLETETERDLVLDPTFRGTPIRKRKKTDSHRSSASVKVPPPKVLCTCSGLCSSKRCGCQKQGVSCSAACKCPAECVNGKIDVVQVTPTASGSGERENFTPNTSSKAVSDTAEKRPINDEGDILSYVKHHKQRKPLIDL